MKRHLRYVDTGMRSITFLTVIGCLLIAGLAGAVFRPASAERASLTGSGAPHKAAPQGSGVQIQEAKAGSPAPSRIEQERPHGLPLDGGSILELRNGRMTCRVATEEEARVMHREHGQQLHVIADETLAPGSQQQQTRKGLKIVLRSTQQLEQFPEAKAAFLRAARVWESLIQNPITVVIDVDYGPTAFGAPYDENTYGVTKFQRNFGENYYSNFRAALIKSAGSPEEAAIYNALPPAQLPTDLGAATGVIYHVAALRALRVLPPVADPEGEQKSYGSPPSIGFNSAVSFDFDPSDGISPKRIDFNASALHEIGHALGFFSGVGLKETHPDIPITPEPLDLFRFRPGVTSETFPTAQRILSSGGDHILFAGGLELPLSTGRDTKEGGDGQQAGHWKDDEFTERYLGIMDPLFRYGVRYGITSSDREAFELLGYRMNPLPSPQEAELKLDDGGIDGYVYEGGLIVVSRLMPPSYPATLRKLRIMIPPIKDQPDPRGQPITLLIGQGASNGQPPPGSQFTRIETTVPSASADLFLEFTVPNGPTINSGAFFVGYQTPAPYQGVTFAVDWSGLAENRSFYSTNNGADYGDLSRSFPGKSANAMIRAIASVGGPLPPPTPKPDPTPTPTPTTTPLTSGEAKDGYLARSSTAGTDIDEIQYTIQAPKGATQLKIELSADTDVDLYARFGKRVGINNGFPIADFKSVSDEYHESITITPADTPALQEGMYYLMVTNYGPGPSRFKITATVTGGSEPAPGKVVSVSAANYVGGVLASAEIVAAFGERLATRVEEARGTPECPFCLPTELAGTTVKVKDSTGREQSAFIFFVSPNQVNYMTPYYLANGPATVTVTSGDGSVSVETVEIANVAPGLFTPNNDGQGVPAGFAVRVTADKNVIFEEISQYDSATRRFMPLPLDLGPPAEALFLSLYGTGLRNYQNRSAVSVKIGGVEADVQYIGAAQLYAGLDQVNVLIPRSLNGRGEVDVALTVDGKRANIVKVKVR